MFFLVRGGDWGNDGGTMGMGLEFCTCCWFVDCKCKLCLQHLLQHNAIDCNMLQHTATHCNKLQHLLLVRGLYE